MSNELSNLLKKEIFSEASADPFLMLVTLSHASFDTIRLVNNNEDVISNGNSYKWFPMNINLPTDDAEEDKRVTIVFDNVSQYLVDELRLITTPIDAKIEMVLASNPNVIEITLDQLKMKSISLNSQSIQASLTLDDFLYTELSSERYTPTNFPGLFS